MQRLEPVEDGEEDVDDIDEVVDKDGERESE